MNFTFQNISFLYGLPVALLPIIIHLLFRIKPKRVPFSDIRFLALISRQILPRSKLRQIILLLMRCLVLALLCLSFSQPVWYAGKFRKGDTHQILIFIDSSYSMHYYDRGIMRFAKAKEVCQQILSNILSSDMCSIATFSNRIEKAIPTFTSDRATLMKFISQTEPTYRTTSIVPIIKYGYNYFHNNPSEGNKTIIIISDLCFPDKEILSGEQDIKLVFIALGHIAENTFIKDVTLLKDKITFSIQNDFTVDRHNCGIFCEYNGKTIYDNILSLPKKQIIKTQVVYKFTQRLPEEHGLLRRSEGVNNEHLKTPHSSLAERAAGFSQSGSGIIELQKDNLPEDDKYYFVYDILPPIKVLIIDGEPKFVNSINSESYYLATALSGALENITYEICTLEEFQSIDISKFDVLILANVSGIDSDKQTALREFIASRKMVLIFLGDKVDGMNYSYWLPVNIGLLRDKPAYVSGINLSNFPHANTFELDKIVVDKYFILSGPINQIITLSDNNPLLVQKDKVFVFATTADRAWTNLPVKPFFVPLLRYIITSSAEQQTGYTKKHLYIGEPIEYVPQGKDIQVITPEGIPAKFYTVGNKIIFDRTNLPGIYQIKDSGFCNFFAINLDRTSGESSLVPIKVTDLKKMFPGAPVTVIETTPNWVEKLMIILRGKKISVELFYAACVLLLLELWLSNPRKLS